MKKFAKNVQFKLNKPNTFREAATLAGLVCNAALQMQGRVAPSVINHLSILPELQGIQQIKLEDLISIEVTDRTVRTTVICDDANLTLSDILAPGSKCAIASPTLRSLLDCQQAEVPLSIFRQLLADWRHASRFRKALLLALHAEYAGAQVWQMNCNLSDARQAKVDACRDAGIPLQRVFRHDLAELNDLGAVCLTLELHTSNNSRRPHLHGICTSESDWETVWQVSCRLAGMRGYAAGLEHANKPVRCYFSPGSVLYSFKTLDDDTESSMIYLSHEALRTAEAHLADLKRAFELVTGKPACPRGRPLGAEKPVIYGLTPIHLPSPAHPTTPSNQKLLLAIASAKSKLHRARYPGRPKAKATAA